MKKNILNLFILKVCIILVSCNSIQQKTPPIEDKVETTESVGVKEQSLVKAFLQELYDKYVFGNDGVCNFEDIVEHFPLRFLPNCVMNSNTMVAVMRFGFSVLGHRMAQKQSLK